MTRPNPTANPKLFEVFKLAGQTSPGVLKQPAFPDAKRVEGWDVATAPGKDGGGLEHKGAKPQKFSCEIELWVDENGDRFADWEKWSPLLATSSKDGDEQQALDIYHPTLDELGITSVVVATWEPPKLQEPGGSSVVKIEFIDAATLKTKNTGAPKGSANNKPQGGGGGNNKANEKPDPNADLKRQLAQRRQEYKEI